jgi:predicted dehydrogenase
MPVETDDTAHALLRFASGAMGTFSTSWTAAASPGFHLDAFGSKGRLRIEAIGYPSVTSATLYAARSDLALVPSGRQIAVPERLFTVDGRVLEPDPNAASGGQRVSLARLFDGFVEAVRGGGEPPVSFARCLEVQTIIEALYESHARRCWIDIERQASA